MDGDFSKIGKTYLECSPDNHRTRAEKAEPYRTSLDYFMRVAKGKVKAAKPKDVFLVDHGGRYMFRDLHLYRVDGTYLGPKCASQYNLKGCFDVGSFGPMAGSNDADIFPGDYSLNNLRRLYRLAIRFKPTEPKGKQHKKTLLLSIGKLLWLHRHVNPRSAVDSLRAKRKLHRNDRLRVSVSLWKLANQKDYDRIARVASNPQAPAELKITAVRILGEHRKKFGAVKKAFQYFVKEFTKASNQLCCKPNIPLKVQIANSKHARLCSQMLFVAMGSLLKFRKPDNERVLSKMIYDTLFVKSSRIWRTNPYENHFFHSLKLLDTMGLNPSVALLEILSNEKQPVSFRKKAIDGLVGIGSGDIESLLDSRTSSPTIISYPPNLRGHLYSILIKHYPHTVDDLIPILLREPNGDALKDALQTLTSTKVEHPRIEDLLIKYVRMKTNREKDFREGSVSDASSFSFYIGEVIERYASGKTIDLAIGELAVYNHYNPDGDKRPSRRIFAFVDLLGSIRSRRSLEALKLLVKSPSPAIGEAVLEVLGRASSDALGRAEFLLDLIDGRCRVDESCDAMSKSDVRIRILEAVRNISRTAKGRGLSSLSDRLRNMLLLTINSRPKMARLITEALFYIDDGLFSFIEDNIDSANNILFLRGMSDVDLVHVHDYSRKRMSSLTASMKASNCRKLIGFISKRLHSEDAEERKLAAKFMIALDLDVMLHLFTMDPKVADLDFLHSVGKSLGVQKKISYVRALSDRLGSTVDTTRFKRISYTLLSTISYVMEHRRDVWSSEEAASLTKHVLQKHFLLLNNRSASSAIKSQAIYFLAEYAKTGFKAHTRDIVSQLAKVDTSDLIPHFLGFLKDEDGDSRKKAIDALLMLNVDILPLLLKMKPRHANPDFLRYVGRAMGDFQKSDYINTLMGRLASTSDPIKFKLVSHILLSAARNVAMNRTSGKKLVQGLLDKYFKLLRDDNKTSSIKRLAVYFLVTYSKYASKKQASGIATSLMKLKSMEVFVLWNLATISNNLDKAVRDVLMAKISDLLVFKSPPYEDWFNSAKNPNNIITARLHNQMDYHSMVKPALEKDGYREVFTYMTDGETLFQKVVRNVAGEEVTLRVIVVDISSKEKSRRLDIRPDLRNPNYHVVSYSGHSGMGGKLETKGDKEMVVGKKIVAIWSCSSMPSYFSRIKALSSDIHFIGNVEPSYSDDDIKGLIGLMNGIAHKETYEKIDKRIKALKPYSFNNNNHSKVNYILPDNPEQFSYASFTEFDIGGEDTLRRAAPREDRINLNQRYGRRVQRAVQNTNVTFNYNRSIFNNSQFVTGNGASDDWEHTIFFGNPNDDQAPVKFEQISNGKRPTYKVTVNPNMWLYSRNDYTVTLLWEANKYLTTQRTGRFERADKLRGIGMIVEYIHYRYTGDEVVAGIRQFKRINGIYNVVRLSSSSDDARRVFDKIYSLQEAVDNGHASKIKRLERELLPLIN